jgi:hypothetical protein
MFAPVDVLMAYPTGLLTGPCDRSRVGIGVTYAAGGASLTGIIYRERLTTISSRNVSQRHCVTGFIQNLGNLICRLTEIMVFFDEKDTSDFQYRLMSFPTGKRKTINVT